MTGLVLEGGGVRGSYQVGAYYAFKKCHIKFDIIVGTSIGSINGALLAAKKEKTLLKFWESVDVSKILGLDSEFAELIKNKKVNNKLLTGIGNIIKQGGLKTQGLRNILDEMFDEEDLRKSNIDFGLVTVRLNTLKPIEIFKKDIPQGKLKDYLIASCYLPVFKSEKIIDDNNYFDGGIINNLPISMLEEKKCDKIYAVRLGKFSVYKKVKDKSNVTIINPSKNLGSVLGLDAEIRKKNIKLGYYDTLRVLKDLDGDEYYFKNKKDSFYTYLMRKIDKQEIRKVMNYFKAKSDKEIVLKAIEFVLKKENVEDLDLYNPYKIIKMIKKEYYKDHFVYKFIKKLRWW